MTNIKPKIISKIRLTGTYTELQQGIFMNSNALKIGGLWLDISKALYDSRNPQKNEFDFRPHMKIRNEVGFEGLDDNAIVAKVAELIYAALNVNYKSKIKVEVITEYK